MSDLQDLAVEIAKEIRANFPDTDLAVQQVLCLAEEAGEVQDAFLLWQDGGTRDDVAAELADVLITAYVTAEILGIDMYVKAGADPSMYWVGRYTAEVLRLGRAAGGFVGSYRRWAGMARRSGSWGPVTESLGEVVRQVRATAVALGIDLDAAWREKAATIMSRGWRDKPAEGEQVSVRG